MRTVLEHTPDVRLPRLATPRGPKHRFFAWGCLPVRVQRRRQRHTHVLATRSAGWRVPVRTTADSPRLCAPERTCVAKKLPCAQ